MPLRPQDLFGPVREDMDGLLNRWAAALGTVLLAGALGFAALVLLAWAGAQGLARLRGDTHDLWPWLLGVGGTLLLLGGCTLAWRLARLTSGNRHGLLRGTVTGEAAPSLGILVLMVAAGPFADTEYTPSLPGMAEALGVEYGTVELTMTTYLLG